MMSGRARILDDGRLEERGDSSLDIERRLRVTSFGTNLRVDVAIVIVELQRVLFNIWQRYWLENKRFLHIYASGIFL